MTPNTCPKADEYRGTLIDMALDDTAHCDALKLAEVIRHVDACPHCKAELIEYQYLIASLRPRVPEVSLDMVPMLEGAVRAEVARIRRRPRILRWAAGIAVAAAIVAACVLLWPSGEIERLPKPDVVAEAPEAPTEQVAELPAPPKDEEPEAAANGAEIPAGNRYLAQEEQLGRATELRERAQKHLSKQEFAEAEAPLREAIGLMRALLGQSHHGEAALKAQFELYRCYELLGDDYQRERAFRDYIERIRARDGKKAAARALVDDSRRLIREGNLTLAGRRLEQVLVICPTGREAMAAHVFVARAHERASQFDSAYKQYQAALALKPSPRLAAGIRRNMMAIKANQGKFDAAIADAEALCALPAEAFTPVERVTHQAALAALHTRKGDAGSAIHILRQTIAESDPQHAKDAKLQLERTLARITEREFSE